MANRNDYHSDYQNDHQNDHQLMKQMAIVQSHIDDPATELSSGTITILKNLSSTLTELNFEYYGMNDYLRKCDTLVRNSLKLYKISDEKFASSSLKKKCRILIGSRHDIIEDPVSMIIACDALPQGPQESKVNLPTKVNHDIVRDLDSMIITNAYLSKVKRDMGNKDEYFYDLMVEDETFEALCKLRTVLYKKWIKLREIFRSMLPK